MIWESFWLQLALSTVFYLSTSSLTDSNLFVIPHSLPFLASILSSCLEPHITWPLRENARWRGSGNMDGPSINMFPRTGIWNIHLSRVKDIENLMSSLSSRSTLLIRNKLEMQGFFFFFPKCCKDVCWWWSWSFPVGQWGFPWSINADKNDCCFWWGCQSLVSEFGKGIWSPIYFYPA